MIAALRKELLIQWRTRGQVIAVFIFGATSLLLFSFGVGPNAEVCGNSRRVSFGWLCCSLPR